jgi:hypothetical protein
VDINLGLWEFPSQDAHATGVIGMNVGECDRSEVVWAKASSTQLFDHLWGRNGG